MENIPKVSNIKENQKKFEELYNKINDKTKALEEYIKLLKSFGCPKC